MADIINLNQARKARAKAGKTTTAAANRARSGRTKAEKAEDAKENDRRDHLLDGAKREEAHTGPTFRGRRYAAFLFDMDGTMLDSSAVVDRVWRAWAERRGVDLAALAAAVHGVRAVDTVRRFAPDVDAVAEAEALLQAEMADMDGVVAIAGIAAFVAPLEPGTWAVVTSAPRALAERRLRAVGLPVPATLVAAEDVTHGKPDPEGYLAAAERLGVPIASCLVFEDSAAGVAAAHAAGADVVVIGDRADGGLHTIADYERI